LNRLRHPVLRALLAQLIALSAIQFAATLLPGNIWIILLCQGALAAILGRLFGLANWWLPLNLLLPLAVVLMLAAALPPWLYLLGFVLLWLVQWNSAAERVPLYLSNRPTWQALDALLPQGPVRMIDLGSGLAGTLLYLARRHPESHFIGVESAPLPFALGWLRGKLAGSPNLQLHYGSIWDVDLSEYDVIYAFLSPAPMARLEQKLSSEQHPGSLFISNSFPLPNMAADRIETLSDRRQTRLYLFTAPPAPVLAPAPDNGAPHDGGHFVGARSGKR